MAHRDIRGVATFLVAIGVTADNRRPLLRLFPRSLNLIVDDLSRFRKGLGWRYERHRCAQPQPVFIEYRHDDHLSLWRGFVAKLDV